MGVTVKVNGSSNTLVHKGSNGISTATIPDVCKTPSPGGPVPIPYPNIAQSSTLDKGTTTVNADGGNMIAIKGSEFSQSNGDEAGTAGGVKSSVNMKEATWILYSFDVKMDGQNACRLSDKMFHNKENTVNMAGEMQTALNLSDTQFQELCDNCMEQAEERQDDNEQIAEAYDLYKDNPRFPDGPSVTNHLAGGSVPSDDPGVTAGNYNPVTDQININNDPDPNCGPVHDVATMNHERIHQQRRNNLVNQGLTPGTPEFAAQWEDRQAWCEDDVRAHNETARTYRQFRDDCNEAS